jgi:hypothetical protein
MRYKLVMTALQAELVEVLCESIDLDIREQHHLGRRLKSGRRAWQSGHRPDELRRPRLTST